MITATQMSHQDMIKTAGNHTCGVCGGRLLVAWGGSFNVQGYILRCGKDINHDTISGHDKTREEQIRILKEIQKVDSKALALMDENTMLQRVNMAKFPQDLTPAEKKMLAQVAITYGFDPLMKEVTIFQGQPYVSIDGRYRKAQETGLLNGVETRPATKEEKTDWEITAGDYFFRAEVSVKGATKPFVGWGRVRASETQGGKGFKPVETNPQRMAEKRAEAQALRKAFHIPLPSVEDIGVEDNGAPSVKVIEVNKSTGEIIEDTKPIDKPLDKPVDNQSADLMTLELKNAGEFMQACLMHFNLQPSAVKAEVGEYDLNIAKQRKEAWAKIVEPRTKKEA